MNPFERKIIAQRNKKERDFWLKIFDETFKKSVLPYSFPENVNNESVIKKCRFKLNNLLIQTITKLTKGNKSLIHAVFISATFALFKRYLKEDKLTLGTLLNHNKNNEVINTILPIQIDFLNDQITAKQLLTEVQKAIICSIEHAEYPMEILAKEVINEISDSSALFDVAVLMEGLHNIDDFYDCKPNIILNFYCEEQSITLEAHYNSNLYSKRHIEYIITNFLIILEGLVSGGDIKVSDTIIPGVSEVTEILSNSEVGHGQLEQKSIIELFNSQVQKFPDRVALEYGEKKLTYGELCKRSDLFANELIKNGVKNGTPVGIFLEQSFELIIAIIGVLKAGGIYVPIDISNPIQRVKSIIDDCSLEHIITKHKYNRFLELKFSDDKNNYELTLTDKRDQIKDLDSLPFPDRSLIDTEKYKKNIGIAMCKDYILLQATRGCPYKCAYCHKIWPKSHVCRSAENIFEEVKIYYEKGFRRFVFIDDIFNLNIKNSTRFFELIIKGNLDVNFFFPAGIRGDIMTPDYIDLMAEAGTINLALALETASERIQKLIGKNLKLDRFSDTCKYLCEKYPNIITDLFVMIGFPTETKKESLQTMEFIKENKWFHFPLINILKIYPNTDIERIALENGISREAIKESQLKAYHELPNTLPFDYNFVSQIQSDFLNNYFLNKERLTKVLSYQLRVLKEDEIISKYNSYLPTEIHSLNDLLSLAGIKDKNLYNHDDGRNNFIRESIVIQQSNFENKSAIKILLIDLSQFFKNENKDFYYVSENPLGLMYLLTYAKKVYDDKINGKIIKSGVDFDDYDSLWHILNSFKPDLIGIRSLNYYCEFFHKTVNLIRSWGIKVPIIAGGPYATSNYKTILQDTNVDLVVLGEGEQTFVELLEVIINNGYKLPTFDKLEKIKGIAFRNCKPDESCYDRKIVFIDNPVITSENEITIESKRNLDDLAYIMYTSGTTGRPKGALIPISGVLRLVHEPNYINFKDFKSILQTGAIDFDASTFELWGALLNGLKLILVPKEEILIAENFKSVIHKSHVDIMWLTSPLFNNLIDIDPEIFKFLKILIVGGDVLSPSHINKLIDYKNNIKIINGYGPTENTTFSTCHPISKKYFYSIPIGQPISFSNAFILDDLLRVVPIGAVGELYVGGKGIAKGYLNSPELTYEHFVPNPFIKNETLYKTGDLAWQLPNKEIIFAGRKDKQIKIRGFRIEPKEIEHFLLKDRYVKNCKIMAITSKSEKELFAFIVQSELFENNEQEVIRIKKLLKSRFPDYMIPAKFIFLDNIPIDLRGKVAKNKLIAIALSSKNVKRKTPSSETEKKLALIWEQALDIPYNEIGSDSNFFELGGHSLKVTIMASLIQSEFNVKISFSDFFKNPVIEDLAKCIEKNKQEVFQIKKSEKKEYYHLAPPQERIFIVQNSSPNTINYNIPLVFPIENAIPLTIIKSGINELINRHFSFRTYFKFINKTPFQFIKKEVKIEIPEILCKREEIGNVVKNITKPFNLEEPPLIRVFCIIDQFQAKYLYIDIHHIISDGMSHEIIFNEVLQYLGGIKLPELSIQYYDYSEWFFNSLIKKDIYLKQKQFWLSQFENNISSVELPIDQNLVDIPEESGEIIEFTLDKSTDVIKSFLNSKEITLFMFLYASYSILLSKYSKSADITIGIPISGRTRTQLNNVVGMFINMLPLRSLPSPEKNISDYIKEVKNAAILGFENQDFQFEEMIDHLNKTNMHQIQLFETIFTMQNSFNLDALRKKAKDLYNSSNELSLQNTTTKYKLALDSMEAGNKIVLWFTYSKKYFQKPTIEKMINHFREITSQIIDKNPDGRIADLSLSTIYQKVELHLLEKEINEDFMF